MSGINKCIIVGNLGKDPEVRFMPNGDAVVNITVATSDEWKDKQTGEQKEKTEWHKVAIFGNLAEIAGQYLTKGSQVYIEGQLQTRKWQDQNGQDRYTTEIVAKEMQMLDSGEGNSQRNTGINAPAQGNRGAAQSQQPEIDSFDDDIPF